jgi:hypothetical protein
MRIILWLFAVAASGASGFYLGIGCGAKTMGAIAAQNEISGAVARVRISVDALGQSDLTQANKLFASNLTFALVQIGTYSQGHTLSECTDKVRETMQAARRYTQAHPEVLAGALQQWQVWQTQGLEFCPSKEDAQARGA